jgi:predicted  nucleic acid-binding Zn-ribbon protein
VIVALSASPEVQAKLLDMADYDRALNRATATQATLADTLHIPGLTAAVEELRGRRHEAFVELEGIRSELARAESDVVIVDKRIATDKERLEHTASAKDAQGLEHELQSLTGRRSDLEDIELAIMERLDDALATESQIAGDLVTAEEALARARTEEQTQSVELAAEASRLGSARAELVALLPSDLVALYERQRERYGQGASHLRAGVSSASGVALTESDIQAVRQAPADEVLLCPDSNAILIRTAESGL